jgi:hypothetical protein
MDLLDPKTCERLQEDRDRREREVRRKIFELSKIDTQENRDAILALMTRHHIKRAIQWMTNVTNVTNEGT